MRRIRQLKRWHVIAIAAVALIAFACGGAEEPAPAVPAAAAPAPAAPAPSGAVASDVTITMAIPEVTAPFGDYEVQTYGASPGETNMGFFDQPLVHDGTEPMAPWAAESWSINAAGNGLTMKIRDGMKVNTPEVFAGQEFGFITAEDIAWNFNTQNAVVNPSLGAAIGAQLGANFLECSVADSSTVTCPIITKIF